MVYWVLAGLVVLVFGLLRAHWFVGANPALLARRIRGAGATLLGGLALLCFATGRVVLAVPFAAAAALLAGWPAAGGGAANPSPGQTSAVETPWLAMML